MSRSNKDREKVADHQQDMFLIKTRQKGITDQQGFTVFGIAWLTWRSIYHASGPVQASKNSWLP